MPGETGHVVARNKSPQATHDSIYRRVMGAARDGCHAVLGKSSDEGGNGAIRAARPETQLPVLVAARGQNRARLCQEQIVVLAE